MIAWATDTLLVAERTPVLLLGLAGMTGIGIGPAGMGIGAIMPVEPIASPLICIAPPIGMGSGGPIIMP